MEKNTTALSNSLNEVCYNQSGVILYRILIAMLATFQLSSLQLHLNAIYSDLILVIDVTGLCCH